VHKQTEYVYHHEGFHVVKYTFRFMNLFKMDSYKVVWYNVLTLKSRNNTNLPRLQELAQLFQIQLSWLNRKLSTAVTD